MNQSQAIEKVQKLLGLSKSSNINEAATAAAIANKYIVQYRLKEADLIEQVAKEQDREGEYFPQPIFDDPDPAYQTGRVTNWKLQLLTFLAKNFGCAVFNDKRTHEGRSVSRFRLLGRFNDIQFTKQLFKWLVSEIERHSESECKGLGSITSSSFCKGAVKGVETLLRDTKEEHDSKALVLGCSQALARIDNREEEAQEYMYRKYNLIRPSAPKPKFDPGAFERGFNVGEHIGRHIRPEQE